MPLSLESEAGSPQNHIAKTLAELYRLLEEYAPPWYTVNHHQKTELAFADGPVGMAKALIELVELLEEYAPAWYTERSHHDAQLALRALKRL